MVREGEGVVREGGGEELCQGMVVGEGVWLGRGRGFREELWRKGRKCMCG